MTEKWYQGRLLLTDQTRKWSLEAQTAQDYYERCCAFTNFFVEDEGRSRQFVKRFNTPKECYDAVEEHNRE